MVQFLQVLQINVNHSQAGHSAALMTAGDLKCDFLCVQDPYVVDGTRLGDALGYPMYSSIRFNCVVYCLNSELNCSLKSNTLNTVSIIVHFASYNLCLTNLYFQPKDNIDNLINEISHFGLNNSFDPLVGDFNARSQIWGYGFEDHRGQVISNFISSNNFSICNRKDLGPTFVTDTSQGFPDLTSISTSYQDYLDSWNVLDLDSSTNHKYICVRLAGDFHPSQEFIFKSKYSFKIFLNIFRKDFDYLNSLLGLASSSEDVDHFYKIFFKCICDTAFGAFKKKPLRNSKSFHFWNDSLRLKRNRVTALYLSFQL
ncbi:hypothetical protein AVEN_203823-1 [Araneus ventricosus]|uniref:Endonuclease/exonuclease/phosphatase domain-containing protein n=1 Tax=Araneus ventricosus TaxID=182803 RepID=A0A4Y2HYV6_ARAVE|nr:hypothetical protein AVEN_203823-1 [Araneus ventricosus]